jgi:outer membrane protein OmpA-like peptidoglycan-associated protein
MLPSMAIAVFGQTDSSALVPRWLSLGAVLSIGPTFELGRVLVPDILECDTLGDGSGMSFGGALLVDLPVTDGLSVQARAGMLVESGELRARAQHPFVLRNGEGDVIDGVYDQVLRFDRRRFVAGLLGRYEIGRTELALGLEALVNGGGDQTFQQEAISPPELLFAGRRTLEVGSGTIVESAPLALGAAASIGFRLPLSRRSWLVPELSLAMPITSLAAGESQWRRLRLAVGAQLRFDLVAEPPQPPIRIDTPVIVARAPMLRPIITTSPAIVEVRVDEYDSTEALALLNQVFFEEGSAELPARYRRLDSSSVSRFSTGQLVGTALDVYYDLLNIVGLRMKRLPQATLAIGGYRNGRETDRSLAKRRAEAIRRYLVDAWGIAPRRLTTTGGGLPASPARENVAEGFEENARAHVVPSDPNVTGPVIRNHIKRVANPPSLVFYPRAEAEAPLRSWRLDVMLDTTIWRRFEGEGVPPDSIVWDWRSNERELPSIPMRLGYELSLEDTTGQRASTPRLEIKVEYRSLKQKLEHRRNDTVIESYSLLLFNFDSPSVSPADQELLRAIGGTIHEPTAVVRITGFTDSLGLESHNRELAMRRATETARILQELTPRGTTIIVDPNGGERERFPYGTPEGRSHNRTVIIEVRRPAAKD